MRLSIGIPKTPNIGFNPEYAESWAFGCFMFGILSMYKSRKLQKWEIYDFMPTLALSTPNIDKCYGPILSDVIWYRPWDPG